jgi:prepilin signal peptidase PulO-like enzyme (type II secretory pathway)
MGGGDVKLMVALGALLGYSQVGTVLVWALLLAVPYALINLIVAGRLNGVLRTAGVQLLQIAFLHRLEPVAPPSRTSIPLAVPLFAALICARVMPQGLSFVGM